MYSMRNPRGVACHPMAPQTTRGCIQSQLLFVNSQRYPLQVLVGETFAYDSISLSMQPLHAISVYICCHNQSEINSYNFVTKEKDRMDLEVGSGTKKVQEGIELGKPSYGYVTFLAGNGDYVKGVVGLAKGLIKANSMYPLVVAILPDVPEEHRMLLRRYGCLVREIEPLAPSLQSSDKYARSYYVLNYSKLRIWQFVEHSKMVYLDGDMQVFESIDHLFELPDKYFYAVADCVCDMYGECCPEVLPWPKVLGPRPSIYFNAGMFVFQPNLSIYVRLLNALKVTPPTQFVEQDFLNIYFKDKYKSIPYVYNLLLAMLWHHPEKVDVNKAKAVHYCFPGAKPWKYTGKEEHMDREDIKMLVKKWWDIYNDTTLDHKGQGSGVDAHRLKATAFSDSDISNCVANPTAGLAVCMTASDGTLYDTSCGRYHENTATC